MFFSLVRVNLSRCRRLLFGATLGSVLPGSLSLRYPENSFHLELFTENGAGFKLAQKTKWHSLIAVLEVSDLVDCKFNIRPDFH